MARPMGKMTAKIENFIRMEARGESHETILREIFGEECIEDKVKRHAANSTMDRWRHRPDYQGIWDDEMKARVRRRVPAAVSRIDKQVDEDNGWLANKAANDMINLARTVGVFQSDEKAINVHIEGMPELGSPDED